MNSETVGFSQKLINISFLMTLLVSTLLLLKVLSLSNVGIDFTDEGFYLNWIKDPWLYGFSLSQFGYFYNIFYQLFGHDLALLRLFNVLLSYGLSYLLTFYLLQYLYNPRSRLVLTLSSMAIALPSVYILMITGHWLPTPSYNSLNFQGFLIASIGLVVGLSASFKNKLLMSILVGIGGWMVFMGKPSSALLLAVAVLLYYLPTIQKDYKVILIAGLSSIVLLIISAIYIDGSVSQFVLRYQSGLSMLQTISNEYGADNLLRLDLFEVSVLFKIQLFVLTFLIFFALICINHKLQYMHTLVFCLLVFSVISCGIYVVFIEPQLLYVPNYHLLLILSVLFASALYASIFKCRDFKYKQLFIILLVIPYLYAAGSGNNYWQTASGVSFFWVLAALVLLAVTNLRKDYLLAFFAGITVTISSVGISNSIQTPYRQPQPILAQDSPFIDPYSGSELLMSTSTSKYLSSLSEAVQSAAFLPGTPLIDLTGHHPSSLYFMQAKAIGAPWMSGGYQGSLKKALLALSQVSCEELAKAWLLIEIDGRRQLPDTLISDLGLQVDKKSYQVVAKFDTQELSDWGAKNAKHPDGIYKHYLVKPLDVTSQTQRCLEKRNQL